jgi:hypothetical protein
MPDLLRIDVLLVVFVWLARGDGRRRPRQQHKQDRRVILSLASRHPQGDFRAGLAFV